ncbi:conserved hypothetical protein [Vibrio phage 448O51-1]|nr:conserved hypothetical protein [Vibrio phage 448O51-1]
MEESKGLAFVYMGERLADGKLYACVCPLVGGLALTSKSSFFAVKKKSNLLTGWIHEATSGEVGGDGDICRINFASAKAVREYTLDCKFAERMRLDQQEHRTQKNMLDKEKKETATKDLRNRLAPIRNAMNKTNHAGKAALLALVIKELTR